MKAAKKILALLLACLLAAAGCVGQEEEITYPFYALEYFTRSDLKNQTKYEIEAQMMALLKQNMAMYQNPFVLSRTTSIRAAVPELDEEGNVLAFHMQTAYEDAMRFLFPGSPLECLYTDETGTQAFRISEDSIQAVFQSKEEGSLEEIAAQTLEEPRDAFSPAAIELVWLSEIFDTGIYETTRFQEVLAWKDDPLVFPRLPQYFTYTLVSRQQDPEVEELPVDTAYVLKISLKDPDAFTKSVQGGSLSVASSYGEKLAGVHVDWKDVTWKSLYYTVDLNRSGKILRVQITEELTFRKQNTNGSTISQREKVITTWNFDALTTERAEQTRQQIDSLLEQAEPVSFAAAQ